MPNCGSNLFYITRPTSSTCNSASASDVKLSFNNCNSTGPVPCPKDISARPNREKIRQQAKDYVLLMLGAPVVRVELDEQQLDLAVDQALKIFEEYAPFEYFQYYVTNTVPGQSVYTMPPDVGYIRNVFYRKVTGPGNLATDLGGSIPLEFMYGSYSTFGFLTPAFPVWGNMGEFLSYKQYESLYAKVSSSIGYWEWIGDTNSIKVYPTPCGTGGSEIVVHFLEKCKNFREITVAIQEGSYFFALYMLGRIRSKIQNPLGPGGGLQLDGQSMLQEAIEGKKAWEERLIGRFGEALGVFVG